MRTCKVCGEKFQPLISSMQRTCSVPCHIKYGAELKEKEIKKQIRVRKEQLRPKSYYVKKAQEAFNSFIRERDKGLPCICCGRVGSDSSQVWDCGHYRSTGSAPHLRFDDRNAHRQLKQCNRYGAGRAVDYRIGLIAKIGLAEVESLEMDNTPRHYSKDQLMQIASEYRKKLRDLQTPKLCSVYGCFNPVKYKQQQVCQTHYHRQWRTSTYELRDKTCKQVIETPNGYVKIKSPGHPLANSDGYAYQHRLIVYARYGESLPDCELCGKPTDWKHCHIDHRDNDRKNNNLENLRPVCRACNTMREYPARHTFKNNHAITWDGQTKTPNEWGKDPRISIAAHTIRARKKRGLSDYECLFSPLKTHNSNSR